MLAFQMRMLQAEIEMQAMIAENKQCEINGESLSYGEVDFMNLIEKHEIYHNAYYSQVFND